MATDLETALFEFAADPWFAHEIIYSHKLKSAPFHEDMVRLYWQNHPRKVFKCFRGAAKSTRAEEAIALQAQMKRFNYYVILGANEDRACDRLMTVKYHLETNENLINLFGPGKGPVWQATRIVLPNGVCIDAIGAGQSLLGMKYLEDRPQGAFADDLEEMSRYLDNVSTPEKRRELAKWLYGSFLPALSKDPVFQMAGTSWHQESLIETASRSPDFLSLTVPVEHLDEAGERISSWPDRYSLADIDKLRKEYEDANQHEVYAQQYMCVAVAPESRSFKQEMFRFDEGRVRTWEPCYVIYDPARTATAASCATGKIVASWVGNRLLVWEAKALFILPDELIEDVFKSDDDYGPIAIGVEETGLNQFVLQPLRASQVSRGHPVPIRPLNPPRGPGKENFILRLQPLFAAGEVIFCGQRQSFDGIVKELLGFPYGLKDTINALAYMMEIKPGVPIYGEFGQENVFGGDRMLGRGAFYLCLNSDSSQTCGVLVEARSGKCGVIADWLESGDGGNVIPGMAASARAISGHAPICYAPKNHFQKYDAIGLRAAAHSAGLRLMQGGGLIEGRGELRRLMTIMRGQQPLFQVSKEATWTLRAMTGGYAREPDKTEAMPGGYRLIGEALESFAAVLAMGALDNDGEVVYAETKDGRRYISAAQQHRMPEKPVKPPRSV